MKKQRILVVDDYEIVTMSTQHILVDAGFEVVIAESGEQASEQLEENSSYDLVITDLMMHEVSGVDVFKKVLEKNVNTHVLIMSGFSTDSSLFKEALELKPCGQMLKPFNKEDLLEKIRVCLEES